jgi:uncharacterized lipoprotein YmbA
MRTSLCFTVILAALALGGCASAPVALVALPSAAAPSAPFDEKPGPTILVRSVTLPGYLDTFPIVLGRTDGALVMSSGAEWAERLPEGVARVMRDALSQRLGASRVLLARDGRRADVDLTIEFLSLVPYADRLNIDERWFFSCAVPAESSGGRTRLEVPLARATSQAVAHATTAALTRFADELALQLPCSADARWRTEAARVPRTGLEDLRGRAH